MTSSSYSSDNRHHSYGGAAYAPSAPPAPDLDEPQLAHPYNPSRTHQDSHFSSSYSQPGQTPSQGSYSSSGGSYGSVQAYPYNYPQQQQQQQQYQSHNQVPFPPGTHPDVIRSFQMVDKDRSGFIDAWELHEALSSGYHEFNIRTIRLLIFLFKSPHDSALRIGVMGFSEFFETSEAQNLGGCLQSETVLRAIFDRSDRDRSGRIDSSELKDALYSLGYTVPPSVLELLISRYANGTSRRVELDFDCFVECGMIVKGLTDKFKEKDQGYTGSATLGYDEFISMVQRPGKSLSRRPFITLDCTLHVIHSFKDPPP